MKFDAGQGTQDLGFLRRGADSISGSIMDSARTCKSWRKLGSVRRRPAPAGGALGCSITSSWCRSRWRTPALVLQPVAGDVQPALDGADRRLELAAHLLQRPAADVERHQRLAVQRLQPLQAAYSSPACSLADHRVQRRRCRPPGAAPASPARPLSGPCRVSRLMAMRTVICRSQPAKQAASRSCGSFRMTCRNTSCASSCASVGLRSRASGDGVDRRTETLDQLDRRPRGHPPEPAEPKA